MNFLEPYKQDIKALCLKYNVKSLYAFGSVLTADFGQDSDVDILVDLGDKNEKEYSDSYFHLADDLEELFGRPVDLLTIRSLKNPFFIQRLEESKQVLYAA